MYLQYNLNSFIIELERAKRISEYKSKQIKFSKFIFDRLALWRLKQENYNGYLAHFASTSLSQTGKELIRSQKCIRYVVEDYVEYGFKDKPLAMRIEEYYFILN